MKLDEIITQEDFIGDMMKFRDIMEPKMKNFADKIKPQMRKGTEDMKQYFDQEFHDKKEPRKPTKDNMLTTDVNEGFKDLSVGIIQFLKTITPTDDNYDTIENFIAREMKLYRTATKHQNLPAAKLDKINKIKPALLAMLEDLERKCH